MELPGGIPAVAWGHDNSVNLAWALGTAVVTLRSWRRAPHTDAVWVPPQTSGTRDPGSGTDMSPALGELPRSQAGLLSGT